MAKITLTREDVHGYPLDDERHELLLFRGELQETPERYRAAKYVLPLIDKRLAEISAERNRLRLGESNPKEFAEKVRDIEAEQHPEGH